MKNRRFAAAMFLALLASCGSGPPAPVAAAKAPEKAEKPRAGFVTLDAKARAEARIQLAEVRRRSLPETVTANGRLSIDENRTWRVGAVTDGRIVQVAVNVGDSVTQGQVLARMHSHDVHEGRAAYQKALSESAKAKSQEQHARRSRDRLKTLLDLKAASREQLDHAEAELRASEEQVKQAAVEIERARTHLTDFLGVAADDPDHGKSGAHGDDDWIPVKAPANGTLLERKVTVGGVVQPGADLFVITDTARIWMIAQVAEEHFARLRQGMAANVEVQAHPGRAFRGALTRFGEQLDVETRTIPARIELANPGGLLKPEMYASAAFELSASREALLIPEAALQEVKGHSAVFVQRGEDSFEAAPVRIGRAAGGMLEVLDGLAAGDRVVAAGAFVLKSQLMRAAMEEE